MARAFESYRTVLRGEMYMFFAFLGAYVLVVLTGITLLIVKSRRTATHVPVEVREVKLKSSLRSRERRVGLAGILLHE